MATFTCEVSKSNLQPTWRNGETVLEASEKIMMESKGNQHTLTIPEAELEDAKLYTVIFEDNVETSATLIVDG